MTTLIDDMPHRVKNGRGNWRKTLTIMAGAAVAVMVAGTYWDVSATAALIRNALPDFNNFMGRTVFEGNLPGANDLVSFFMIAAIVVYISGGIKGDRRIGAWRPHAGFVITSGLIIGLFMVHGLKYLVGRARPSMVINENWPYSLWFVFGPHAITEGTFNASFPSGHTAHAFILMAGAYLLAGDPLATRTARTTGWIWGALALLYTAAMGVARCASQHHWLTDILGSICLGWLLMHWIYFGLLQVPAQRRYGVRFGRPPALPRAWELMLCIAIFFMGAGAIMAFNSLRVILDGARLGYAWLIPAGALLAWGGWRLLRRYRRAVDATLGGIGKAS